MSTMQIDKQAHFFAGAAIASTVALYVDPLIGLVAGAAAGLLKEVVDFMGYGTPDYKDALATLFGACVVIPAFFI